MQYAYQGYLGSDGLNGANLGVANAQNDLGMLAQQQQQAPLPRVSQGHHMPGLGMQHPPMLDPNAYNSIFGDLGGGPPGAAAFQGLDNLGQSNGAYAPLPSLDDISNHFGLPMTNLAK